jgi:hypothetical protein
MYLMEPGQYAPDYLKKLVAAHNAENGEPRARLEMVAIARRYESSDPKTHPALRDRTPEIARLLKGYVGSGSTVRSASYTGAELHSKFGYDAVGAQFSHTYDLLWVNEIPRDTGPARTEALDAAIAAVEDRAVSRLVLSSHQEKLWHDDRGKTYKFMITAPFKGDADVAYFSLRPRHLDGDWLIAGTTAADRMWMIPMSVLKPFLIDQPLFKAGRWDIRAGRRRQDYVLFVTSDQVLNIKEFEVALGKENAA